MVKNGKNNFLLRGIYMSINSYEAGLKFLLLKHVNIDMSDVHKQNIERHFRGLRSGWDQAAWGEGGSRTPRRKKQIKNHEESSGKRARPMKNIVLNISPSSTYVNKKIPVPGMIPGIKHL